MMKYFWLVVLSLTSMSSFAQNTEDEAYSDTAECSCTPSDQPETIVEVKSAQDNTFTMRFLAKPIVSRKRITAHLCSESATIITQAKLWMRMPNGHEHGSTPTELRTITDNCTIVTKINPIMSGEWQVLIATKDKDDAKLIFNVENPK